MHEDRQVGVHDRCRFYHGTLRTSTLRTSSGIGASRSPGCRPGRAPLAPPPPYDLQGEPRTVRRRVEHREPSRGGRRLPVHDVLVVGGGPSGSACAYWLADAGWDVVVVEKKHFPREKTCGDGLTPRAVRQLDDMGLSGALAGAHRFEGLRACAFGDDPRDALARSPVVPVGTDT